MHIAKNLNIFGTNKPNLF